MEYRPVRQSQCSTSQMKASRSSAKKNQYVGQRSTNCFKSCCYPGFRSSCKNALLLFERSTILFPSVAQVVTSVWIKSLIRRRLRVSRDFSDSRELTMMVSQCKSTRAFNSWTVVPGQSTVPTVTTVRSYRKSPAVPP